MSKNLTRKGLAMATGLAFGLTGLSALPAAANDQGFVTLTPEYGTSFNGVTDTQFTLETVLDDDINDGAERLSYLIENPNNAELIFDTYADDDDSSYDAIYRVVNGNFDSMTTYDGSYDDAKMVIQAPGVDQNGNSGWANYLYIDTDQTADALGIKVTAWIDRDGDKVVDAGEYQSTPETLNFYDPTTLNATATLNSTPGDGDNGFSNLEVDTEYLYADVALSNNVNVNYVDGNDWAVAAQRNGRDEAQDSEDYDAAYEDGSGDVNALDSDLENDYGTDSDLNLLQYTIDLDDLAYAGNYSVRAAYIGEDSAADWTWASARSAVFPITEGTNDDVDGFVISAPDANTYESGDDHVIRSGAKAITYTAQAVDSNGDAVESSNVRVKIVAYIDGNDNWSDGGVLSVSGGNKTVKDEYELITAYGRTDTSGKFAFTITDSAANAGDYYDFYAYFLGTDGAWDDEYYDEVGSNSSSGDYEDNYYEDAYVDSFEFAKDVLAGSNVSATLEAEDQFGEPISKLGTKDLKVNIVDADDDTKLDKTATLVNGAATFTWSNYLAKGDTASIDATLFTGANVDSGTEEDNDTATVYNPEATGAVIADKEVDGVVTYSDYVIGDSWSTDNDDDTVEPADADAYPHHVVVEDANGAGLPAAVVTVAGKGLLFEDDADQGTYYADSITVVANEQGEIDVNVWAHKVGEIVITTTSGGKSATTTLTTELNDSLTVDDVLISWNAPKHPAVNKLYVVSTSVTDKWGNGLPGATVDFNTDGVLQVNGDDQKTKDANSYGKATVYVGGVKNLSGVGSITAEITDLVIPADSIEGGELDLSSTIENGESTSITREVLVGTDATAAAGKLAGKLKVTAWNATGSAVQVYVGGKLVATRTASAKTFKFKLAGLAKGTKNVTVKVAGSTYFKDVVTIK